MKTKIERSLIETYCLSVEIFCNEIKNAKSLTASYTDLSEYMSNIQINLDAMRESCNSTDKLLISMIDEVHKKVLRTIAHINIEFINTSANIFN